MFRVLGFGGFVGGLWVLWVFGFSGFRVFGFSGFRVSGFRGSGFRRLQAWGRVLGEFLDPKPYTPLNPKPQTPNPKVQTLNPKPSTLNPKLQTPKTQTPNPRLLCSQAGERAGPSGPRSTASLADNLCTTSLTCRLKVQNWACRCPYKPLKGM